MSRGTSNEDGLTIVEVVVATLILTVGALATFGLLSSATKNTERAKATQVALDRAQRELEVLRNLTIEERALMTMPTPSGNPLNPNYRVNGEGYFALTREPPGNYEELVVNGGDLEDEEEGVIEGGAIDPGPTPFISGDVSGEVYRYVVWRNDEKCGEACLGSQDFKQIIVAVKLDTPGNQAAERGYVEVQSDFVDPTESASNDPLPGPGGQVVTAQQFFLSDTPCAGTGATAREEITGPHLLHNTLGTCADGLKTGTTPGAPDALLLGAPPDPAPADPDNPPLYDYADDFYLEPAPDTDKGLQIRRDDTPGCHYEPTGTANPESQVHLWVTDPVESDYILTDKVTLEFHSRTLNNEEHGGTVCVYLFHRPAAGPDERLTNKGTSAKYWMYADPNWPRFAWTDLKLEMEFAEAPYTIPAGDRLGVALSVERSGTAGADAIPIMYDHPRYATRLEVETTTPLGGS